MAARPSVFVDLTGEDDDSLSELSDAAEPTPSSSSKPKSRSKSSPVKPASTMKKSASSSNVAAAKSKSTSNGAPKPRARKSEPVPPVSANGQSESIKAKGKRKQDDTDTAEPKAAASRPAPPISDVVRARTHVNVPDGLQKLCHQHHQNCKGALLECTFMRAPGKRCQGRFCFSSLKRFYDQDPETIVKSNRMMINPAEHCPPSEAKYAWKCPKCRGKCVCSTCRKAAGLEPLGRPFGSKKPNDTEAGETEDSKSTKAKSKVNRDTAEKVATTSAKTKAKPKERTLAEAVAAAQNQSAKAKSKPKTATRDEEDDGISTPPPPPGAKTKKTLASILSTSAIRTPVLKPLKPPTEVAPPVFEVIPTKLPHDNMRARMWLYESMVRFDKFGLNRTVLSQLDKFENWTHSMAQDMLACLLKTIAGMSNIEKGQPTKPFVRAITAFRTHGKSLQRGEPWSAATELLTILGLERSPLAFVEHDIPVEVEAAAAQRSPSPPPAARATRARRAKESNQYEVARQLSLLDRWEEDEFGETLSDADDEDTLPSKRRRATTQKSIYVYDDPSDDDSMADPDNNSRTRRSGRTRKAGEKEPAPEIRLTGRQQAIKLQQEQQKEEEAAAEKQRKEDEQEARQAEASRKRRPSNGSRSGSGSSVHGTPSDGSDDEGRQTNGRAHKKRRKLTAAGSSDDEAESDNDHDVSVGKGEDDVDADMRDGSQIEQEVESPDLETKISILSALIDAAVMAENVAEELKLAAENIVVMEREQRAANFEMEKEIVEELAELNKRAPSIVAPEYQKWKAEKAQLEQDHAWRRQDARVTGELTIDTHALRTGPLGTDVDGREYWHLREYQERMPKYTEGRYAWCLVVMGPAFPVDSKVAQEEQAKAGDEADASMANGTQKDGEQTEEADDSGLTSLDASSATDAKASVEEKDEVKDVKLGLPTSSICMGANDPTTIKALVDYVRFRLEHVEYEENASMQRREKAARGDTSDAANGDAGAHSSGAVESMYSIRKAKQTLKDTQEERRKQVEQLVKRLNKSKEYFAWHREEVAP